jgi:lysophospholipase L1-like esterase
MNYTDNYNLNLPSFNDNADISALNENFSKIDEKLKDNADAIANVKVTTDQTYSPTSSNPQSGKAVAEAVEGAKVEMQTYVDDAVSRVDVDILETGKNLLDENNLEIGALTSTGTENNGATSFRRTPYIYLKAGSYVYSNYNNSYANFRLCIYDLNKVFESTQAGAGNNVFTIDTPKYIRIHESGAIDNKQLELGTEPTTYEPYVKRIKSEYIPVDDEMSDESENPVKNKVVKKYVDNEISKVGATNDNDNDILETGKNLLDESTLEVGALTDKGVDNNNATSFKRTKEYIYLEAGTYVYSNDDSVYTNFRLCIYDTNKSFESTQSGAVSNSFTIDSPKYIRIHDGNTRNELQLELGSTPTDYEPYIKLIKSEYIPDNEEIKGVRTGYNGAVYKSAGESVRTQISELHGYFKKSKNLIDNLVINEAVASNGAFVSSYNKQRTDYIFLPPNTYTYSNKGKRYDAFAICIYHYDESTSSYVFEKRFVGAENTTFTLGEAKYIALTDTVDADRSQLQLEVGDTATDYEPYKPVTIDVAEQVSNGHFKDKTILFYGDSITNAWSDNDWVSYPEISAQYLGFNVINESQDSGTIAYKPEGTKSSLIDRIRDDSFDVDIDIVYVAMGTNDWAYSYTPIGTMEDRITDDFYDNGETTTFYASLHYLINLLLNRYKGKPIIFATPIKRKTVADATPDYKNGNGKSLKEYCDIIKEVCDYYSIPVIDMYSESMLSPYLEYQRKEFFLETGETATHPNKKGLEIMARRVVAGLRSIVGF